MFDLKYRPKLFSEVLGNEATCAVLKYRSLHKSFENRSLMFGGPKGSGKTSLARIVCRAMVCLSPDNGEPCNKCDNCEAILSGSHSSVVEFDAASNGTVENIREIVKESDYTNFDGTPHILVLDEAHRLGPASQDALLTAMEDRKLVVIMCTTEPHKIRPALRDRVDEFTVRNPSKSDLVKRLKEICSQESIKADEAILSSLIDGSEDSPRVALNALFFLSRTVGFTDESVSDYFKFSSVATLRSALLSLSTDLPRSMQMLDGVISRESPGWTHQTLLNLISGSIRTSMNLPCKPVYRVNLLKDDLELVKSLGRRLSRIDKPNHSDLLIAFHDVRSHVSDIDEPHVKPEVGGSDRTTHSNTVVPRTDTLARFKETPTKPEPFKDGPSAEIEINGIKFNTEERISKLHDKIEPGRGPTSDFMREESCQVQYDRTKIPMSEQEFSRVFSERFR
jgi:DNA polymerase III subunit gamma/tau